MTELVACSLGGFVQPCAECGKGVHIPEPRWASRRRLCWQCRRVAEPEPELELQTSANEASTGPEYRQWWND